MMTEKRVVCIDSGVFLAFLKDEPERGDLVRAVFEDAKAGTIQAVTSTMAVLEVAHLGDHVPSDEARAAIDDLFRQDWLEVFQLTREIAREASILAVRYGPKKSVRDAAYVATAKTIKASYMFTFDDKFLKRYADNSEGLTVCRPFVENPRLF